MLNEDAAEVDEFLLIACLEVYARNSDGFLDVADRDLKTCELLGNRVLNRVVLLLGRALNLVPVLLDETVDPHLHLALYESDILFRVMRAAVNGVTFRIRRAACVQNVNYRIGFAKVVKELVSETAPRMRSLDKSRDIYEPYRDEAHAVLTCGAVFNAETFACAFDTHVCNAVVGVYCRERIVCYLRGCHGCRGKKRRFSAVRLARDC